MPRRIEHTLLSPRMQNGAPDLLPSLPLRPLLAALPLLTPPPVDAPSPTTAKGKYSSADANMQGVD